MGLHGGLDEAKQLVYNYGDTNKTDGDIMCHDVSVSDCLSAETPVWLINTYDHIARSIAFIYTS